MLGPFHQNEHFFGGRGPTPHFTKNEICILLTKSQTFYAMKDNRNAKIYLVQSLTLFRPGFFGSSGTGGGGDSASTS